VTAETTLPSHSDLIDRVFGPVLERQTYRHALYLLLSFPLGIVYFVTLAVGFSVGLGTAIVLAGLVILVVMMQVARMYGRLERQLAKAFLDATFEPPQLSPLKWRAAITDRRTWTTLLYLILRFPIGIVSFVAVILLAASIPLMATPMLYAFLPLSVDGSPISTSGDAMLISLLGSVFFLTLVHVVNGLAAMCRRLATALL
jgi:hypothetical protein